MSDRCAGYKYVPIEQRQVCWAHLLRDFERIAGRSGLAGRIGKRLLAYGYLLFRWRGQGKGERHYRWLQGRIHLQLAQATQQTRCSHTANSCANLLKMWPALWTFVHNPFVPPPNNAAVQTCTMQGRSTFDYVGEAMQAWMAGRSPPSLVHEHVHASPMRLLLSVDE